MNTIVKEKEIKVEWCENWIKALFEKNALPKEIISEYGPLGIEVNLFWNLAEQSGLWIRGTYGTPMSQALEKLTRVEFIYDNDGKYSYSSFKLK